MSRRAKAKSKEPDPDFKIYVDPSCLSAPMDEEPKPTQVTHEEREEVAIESEAKEAPKQEIEDDTNLQNEVLDESESIAHDVEVEQEDSEVLEEADESLEDGDVEVEMDHPEDDADQSVLSATNDGEDGMDRSVDNSTLEDSITEESLDGSEMLEDSAALDEEDEAEESIVSDLHIDSKTDSIEEHQSPEEDPALEEAANASEPGDSDLDEIEEGESSHLEEVEPEEEHLLYSEDPDSDNDDTPRPTQRADDEVSIVDQVESSRRESESSDRRTSLRTEALIQAAARAVMAKLENRGEKNNQDEGDQDHEGDSSILSSTTHEEVEAEGTEVTYDADASTNGSRRESSESTVHHAPSAPLSLSGDDGGDSSSHHEPDDDDVFSDNHSARSSLSGSLGGGQSAEETLKSPAADTKHRDGFIRSPRLSTMSMISGLSQYEKDEAEFVPETRASPRAQFRTPSSLRAQMSSPTPSAFAGSTPRSHHKKPSQGGSVSFPTVSRLGSPNVSAQYSPKGRTPTRFKPRQEAPLVLLHVTLLPLRWMWADVVDNLDIIIGKEKKDGPKTNAPAAVDKFEPSVELRALRDAWRQLQDHVGDTVLERGILLPHPQNDFEILEERLLEALELPLRRRARILECGHYIGPTNLTADDEFSQDESEDEYRPQSRFSASQREKRHWCGTCKGEIKLEDLGPGRIFRVKVYASNGLMKAGAWEACWKEMERVDIEVEPIVESTIQSELERLAILQDEMQEPLDREDHDDLYDNEEDFLPAGVNADTSLVESRDFNVAASSPPGLNTRMAMHASPIQPPPSSALRYHTSYDSPTHSTGLPSPTRSAAAVLTESIDESEARRLRDEERMREIYGDDDLHSTPQLQVPSHHSHHVSPTSSMHAEPTATAPRHPDSYIPPRTPRSPSEEAYERREARDQLKNPYQSASLPQLLLEVVKVLMRDPKNVAIAFLGVLAMFFMLRTAPVQPPSQVLGHYDPGAEAIVPAKAPIAVTTSSIATDESIVPASASSVSTIESVVAAASPSPAPVKEKERKVIRVVETVTETLREEAAPETIYETETIKVTVSASASASASSSAQPSPSSDSSLEREGKALGEPEDVPTHDEI